MYEYTYIQMNVYTYKHTCIRMAHDDHRHPHSPRHSLDAARVWEGMRVYVYLVDGLYRRAELNKHPHCIRMPALACPQQRCPTVFLRALAGYYTIEVTIRLDEREHAHEYRCIIICI